MPYDGEQVDLGCTVIGETPLAIKCEFGDKVEWIPKSLVHPDSDTLDVGDTGTLIIPEWLAHKKGLI